MAACRKKEGVRIIRVLAELPCISPRPCTQRRGGKTNPPLTPRRRNRCGVAEAALVLERGERQVAGPPAFGRSAGRRSETPRTTASCNGIDYGRRGPWQAREARLARSLRRRA